METIKNYLDNMFLNLPDTPETRKAKAELMSMMEDKYNEQKAEGKSENEAIGLVISEFGNLDELAGELGIRGYMNRNQNQYEDPYQSQNPYQGQTQGHAKYQDSYQNNQSQGQYQGQYQYQEQPYHMITLQTVQEYITVVARRSKTLALGVFLCICSPILLILLGGVSQQSTTFSEEKAGGIGIVVLLLLVAVGVGIIIISAMSLSRYDYLKKQLFQLEKDAFDYVNQLREEGRQSFAIRITVGVVLCIVAVIPVVGAAVAYDGNDILVLGAVGLLLLIVAVAVWVFITTGMEQDAYKVLLQEEEYSRKNKDNNKLLDTISSIYWPIVTCGYLGYSLISHDWGRSWIVWPVAGILFGAIACIVNAVNPSQSK